MVLEEGKGKKDTANEKNKCTMKKNKTSAAAQNKTFDSLFKLVSQLVSQLVVADKANEQQFNL